MVFIASLASVTATTYVGTGFTEDNKWKVLDTPLVFARGFTSDANNGLKKVTSLTSTALTITGGGLTTESSVGDASLEVCGVEVSSIKSQCSLSGKELTIIAPQLGTGKTLEQHAGNFIFIGGDTAISNFASNKNQGWARVIRSTSNGVVCDLTTFSAEAVTGNVNNIQLFIPTRVYRDDIKCDDSNRTTHQLERRLGHSDSANPHEQSQLVTGAVANQLDLAMPTKSKVMTTMSFIGAQSFRRTGKTDLQAPWSGKTRKRFDATSLYNMSTDLKYGQIYRHDSSTSKRDTIFGLVLDGTLTLNNNCSPIEGWGVYGAWDINTGSLQITATLTALFTDVAALDLAEEGVDAGLFVIFAHGDGGFVVDIPLMTVQTSPLEVGLNEPVKISLTNDCLLYTS